MIDHRSHSHVRVRVVLLTKQKLVGGSCWSWLLRECETCRQLFVAFGGLIIGALGGCWRSVLCGRGCVA